MLEAKEEQNNQEVAQHPLAVVETGKVRMLGTNIIMTAVSRQGVFMKSDVLVVESDRGHVLARALEDSYRTTAIGTKTCNVVRRLTPKDAETTLHRDAQRKQDAAQQFKAMVRKAGLNMKLSNIEITRDEQKIVFYFTAPGRVDFRQLVRDLAHELHSRIELRQIGVRDEARAIGGLGPCGHPLCCASYMSDFTAVSMRFAKEQGLTLNPQKYSGMCGRLMCCLAYEANVYKDLYKQAPRQGRTVTTPKGKGQVLEVLLLQGRARVRLENGDIEEFPFSDIQSKS